MKFKDYGKTAFSRMVDFLSGFYKVLIAYHQHIILLVFSERFYKSSDIKCHISQNCF